MSGYLSVFVRRTSVLVSQITSISFVRISNFTNSASIISSKFNSNENNADDLFDSDETLTNETCARAVRSKHMKTAVSRHGLRRF